jgi:superoxide dismutase, Cu-Zn family
MRATCRASSSPRTAWQPLATATDRFSIADLRDADGSAVMVHSGADNFANIPARYGGPDQETLSTGDAGSRLACGVVR